MHTAIAIRKLNEETQSKQEGKNHVEFTGDKYEDNGLYDAIDNKVNIIVGGFLRRRPGIILLYKVNNDNAQQGESTKHVNDFNAAGGLLGECHD